MKNIEMQHTFKVGDGATQLHYSDAEACTVIAVTPKSVTVRKDKQTLLNGTGSGEPDALKFTAGGFCGHTSGKQRWAYEPDANGSVTVFRLRKNGRMMNGTLRLVEGRSAHYDFNF